jgi:GNAT superfamily N-acetyltransferase
MALTIREAHLSEAPTIATLCGELGYATSAAEIEARLRRIREAPDHTVLVACSPDGGSYAEIGGLVVTALARGGGIGKELVARAEQWGLAHGALRMVVRSNAVREDAHRFYLREGYERTKTSAIFEKRFPPDR